MVNEDLASQVPDEILLRSDLEIDRYLDQVDRCRECPGIQKCEYNGMRSILKWESDLFGNGNTKLEYVNSRFCNVKIQYMDVVKKEKTLKDTRLPGGLGAMTFDTFKSTVDNQRAIATAKQVLEGKIYHGMYLYGKAGRGKTHLAVAMMQKFMLEGRAGIYVTTADLVEKMKEAMKGEKSFDLLELIQNTPFLLLDDFGVEKPTEWVRERLFLILDHRSKIARTQDYPNGVVTVVTSNYDMNELADKLALPGDPASGERLVSRIRGMCLPVEVKGFDWRVRG